MNNRKGYSLPELMMTLTVAGLITSTALPSINEVRERIALRSATGQFVAAHGVARAAASRYGRIGRLVIDASAGRFWVEVDTTTAATGALTRIGTTYDVSDDGITMMSTSSLLCFDARGIASGKGACSSGAALVRFTHKATTSQVGVTALGKVIY